MAMAKKAVALRHQYLADKRPAGWVPDAGSCVQVHLNPLLTAECKNVLLLLDGGCVPAVVVGKGDGSPVVVVPLGDSYR